MEILEIIKTKDFKNIVNYKCRFYHSEKEDIKAELICRIFETPTNDWSIYHISNELNKIISKIKTNQKYICDKVTTQFNAESNKIDYNLEQYNNLNVTNVNNYKFTPMFSKSYKMEFDDLNYVFLPIFKKILKVEEFLLFKYVYIHNEKLIDIKKATKLPRVTLTYMHKNMKTKIKNYFLNNKDLLNEFLTMQE